MKKIITLLLSVFILISNLNSVCFAEKEHIRVTLDSKEINTLSEPIYKDGVLMLPLVEILEYIDAFVQWDSENHEFIGNRKGIRFAIPLDKATAVYDSVPIELDANTREINGVAMIDSRFFGCINGIETEFNDNTFAITTNNQIDTEYEEWSWDKIKNILPEGEYEVSPEQFLEKYTVSRNEEWMNAKIVDVEGMPFSKALEIETFKQPVNTYDTKIDVDPIGSIRKGDVAVLTFYGRKIKSSHESGNAFTEAIVEQNYGGYAKALMTPITLSSEWKQFALPVYNTTMDLQIEKYDLNFRVGYKPQTIQLADVRLVNYKGDVSPSVVAPDSVVTKYKGMEKDALWRKEALRRIEKYRKNRMRISVVDKEGNAIPNAKVQAKMTRNEFMWGTAADDWVFNVVGNDSLYGRNIKKYFNEITPESTQKWPLIEKNKGIIPARLANWAIENNMYVRGHNLVWDSKSGLPQKLIQTIESGTPEEVQDIVLSHIVEMVRLFGDSVCQWDLLNEPGFNNLMRTKYGYAFAAEWFKAAKYALDGKDVKLYINEMEITGDKKSDPPTIKRLIEIVEGLKAEGAPIDGIGIENHCQKLIYPQDFYNQLDEISNHANEIAVTEYDLKISDKKIAADFLRDEMIVAYSHPKCTGFIMWGFTDKYHWLNNAPLLDSSFNPKPALENYIRTIDDFTTNEEGITNIEGIFDFSGFRGEYDVTVTVNGVSKTVRCCIKKDEPNLLLCVYNGEDISMNPSSTPKVREKINIAKFLANRDVYRQYNRTSWTEAKKYNVNAFDGSSVSAITDNQYNTFWSFDSINSFITVENPLISDATKITLSWKYANPYQYGVYVSDDKYTWQKAEKTVNDHQFEINNHKWVKIINESNRQISLSEIDIR